MYFIVFIFVQHNQNTKKMKAALSNTESKVSLSIRLKSSIAEEVNTLALKENRNVSNMIETILLNHLRSKDNRVNV
jgi:hypothetical protein